MTFKTLIIDLDGTLVHTAPDIARVLNLLLAEAGLPPTDADEVEDMVGGGLAALMQRAFARRGDPEAADRCQDRAQAFLRLALESPAPDSVVYEGVVEVLEQLRAQGYRLAVCTNKTETLAAAVLEQVGLRERLHGLVGGSPERPKKPDPEPVYEAIRRAEGARDSVCFIGDSETDLKSARAAGMPCILVSYGYHHGKLPELDADVVVDRFADIPAALAELGASA